jgi:integrase
MAFRLNLPEPRRAVSLCDGQREPAEAPHPNAGRAAASRHMPKRPAGRLALAEIARLGELALDAHGRLYVLVVAGWISFLAWTGCRPGEAWTRTWSDLDWRTVA